MTIEEFLRGYNTRVTNGDCWLVEDNGEYVVRKHQYRRRVPIVICQGESLESALDILAKAN